MSITSFKTYSLNELDILNSDKEVINKCACECGKKLSKINLTLCKTLQKSTQTDVCLFEEDLVHENIKNEFQEYPTVQNFMKSYEILFPKYMEENMKCNEKLNATKLIKHFESEENITNENLPRRNEKKRSEDSKPSIQDYVDSYARKINGQKNVQTNLGRKFVNKMHTVVDKNDREDYSHKPSNHVHFDANKGKMENTIEEINVLINLLELANKDNPQYEVYIPYDNDNVYKIKSNLTDEQMQVSIKSKKESDMILDDVDRLSDGVVYSLNIGQCFSVNNENENEKKITSIICPILNSCENKNIKDKPKQRGCCTFLQRN